MSVSRPFHVQLYCAAVAASAHEGSNLDYGGASLTRALPPPRTGFFGCSFEAWMQQMLARSGVYAEGDGSWSWTSTDKNERNAPAWRMEGMIYDRDGRLFYVDVQGQCTLAAWQDLVGALDIPPQSSLAICVAELGAWITPSGFEAWLSME